MPDIFHLEGKPHRNGAKPLMFDPVPLPDLEGMARETNVSQSIWRPGHNDIHLWLLPISDPPAPVSQLAELISQTERDRADKFHFQIDRERYIAAHSLTRTILSACGAGAPNELSFATGANNKPRLVAKPGLNPLSFNLSHSGVWALLAVAATGSIGVDIEKIRLLDALEKLAHNTFAPSEFDALMALDPTYRLDGFFACWTRKEALIKADGRGLEIPLDNFVVSVDPNQPARLISANGAAKDLRAFGLWDLPAVSGYRASISAAPETSEFKFFCVT
ncbi:MAG: 4'-phosphopantetheinyl transferase superfamily protein [Alphaproteobacteria bacterium]|nr:4'-phosphopantetheinyl transferase superfamily protein [Alphaproteobacteria bacterium]MBU2144489.1 4'-phosphopantetheinyl transferase superfamily protein [Alphaproteobacteria bacterium]MBU2195496.1 4'-phosphopantetheinyl transferase superfamily protein [Alphaproteobacteria bacterium]